jgi:hypothetical protein
LLKGSIHPTFAGVIIVYGPTKNEFCPLHVPLRYMSYEVYDDNPLIVNGLDVAKAVWPVPGINPLIPHSTVTAGAEEVKLIEAELALTSKI